jgi:hypothetical protein
MDLLLGGLIIALALATVIFLYCWSCRIIERIDREKLTTLRHIKKELENGRG